MYGLTFIGQHTHTNGLICAEGVCVICTTYYNVKKITIITIITTTITATIIIYIYIYQLLNTWHVTSAKYPSLPVKELNS
jgi:hypothetical protein